jgi:hypothetical protein
MISFEDGIFEVDAATIADGLGFETSSVQQRMRDGTLTSRCERGIDGDEGRYRLTFSAEQRCLRLIVDMAGNVVERSTTNSREGLPTRPPGRSCR